MTITLWHCKDSRSLRALWALEELGLPYELNLLQFPPRLSDPGYVQKNPLGTVPLLVDGQTRMTESSAICHYLASRYGDGALVVEPDHAEYGGFLNWLYHADATLTFPQTLILRYRRFEPRERRQPQVVEDYTQWYLARLKLLNAHIEGRDWLCNDRFTVADIAVGYALYLGEVIGLAQHYKPRTAAYLARLKDRPAFARANAHGFPLPGV